MTSNAIEIRNVNRKRGKTRGLEKEVRAQKSREREIIIIIIIIIYRERWNLVDFM